MKISVVVCTYNRAPILKITLATLVEHLVADVEVILIDNHSTDQTAEVFKSVCGNNPNVRYFFEAVQGHSASRNRGLHESRGNWVLYLDDDVKIRPDTLAQAIAIVDQYPQYSCIGGIYNPWYLSPKPKWLPMDYGSNATDLSGFVTITKKTDHLPWGAVVLFQKQDLLETGGFNPTFGMHGNQLGYGDETEVICKLLDANKLIGIDNSWIIDHLVADYKLKLSWHLRSEYQMALAYSRLSKVSFPLLSYQLLRTTIASIVIRLPKLLLKKNYYWQNFILETLKPYLILAGTIKGKLL